MQEMHRLLAVLDYKIINISLKFEGADEETPIL